MGYFKSFLLGVGVSFAVYYITRKNPEGKSMLDDVLEDPEAFAKRLKELAIAEVVKTVKKQIS